jgi:hypothetical protein
VPAAIDRDLDNGVRKGRVMKSFAFGAAAALLAAYTIADDSHRAASADQPDASLHDSHLQVGSAAYEMVQRQKRGLPPFWGRNGVLR